MKPYKKGDIFRYQWVRRCRYGRGHGVHSPAAFALVQSLLRPRAEYYDSELIRAIQPDEVGELWYRCVARLAPKVQYYALEAPRAYMEIGKMADGRSPQAIYKNGVSLEGGGLLTEQAEKACQFLKESGEWVLLKNVRGTKECEASFLQLVETLQSGIILDLYDHALLFKHQEQKYFYRTSL